MTHHQQALHAMQFIGMALMGIGILVAFFNWVFLLMDWQCQKRRENRHVSMVFALGLALPLGCLFIPSIRIHALWIGLLDPASLFMALITSHFLWKKLTRSAS